MGDCGKRNLSCAATAGQYCHHWAQGKVKGCRSSLGSPLPAPWVLLLGKPLEGGIAFFTEEALKYWSRYTVQSFDSVCFKGNIFKLISLVVLRCVRLSFIKPGLRCCVAEQLGVGVVPKQSQEHSAEWQSTVGV